jgi:hypothetical protein
MTSDWPVVVLSNMMSRRWPLLICAYVVTVLLSAVLLGLATVRIDPVRFVTPLPTDDPFFRQHGKPLLSGTGVTIWLVLLVVYVFSLHRMFARHARNGWIPPVAALIASAMIITFAHPLLAPLLMPLSWSTSYTEFLESIRVPVGAGRISYNVAAVLTYVSALQAIVVYMLMVRLARHGTSKHPVGSSVNTVHDV